MQGIKDGTERPYIFHVNWNTNGTEKQSQLEKANLWFVVKEDENQKCSVSMDPPLAAENEGDSPPFFTMPSGFTMENCCMVPSWRGLWAQQWWWWMDPFLSWESIHPSLLCDHVYWWPPWARIIVWKRLHSIAFVILDVRNSTNDYAKVPDDGVRLLALRPAIAFQILEGRTFLVVFKFVRSRMSQTKRSFLNLDNPEVVSAFLKISTRGNWTERCTLTRQIMHIKRSEAQQQLLLNSTTVLISNQLTTSIQWQP